MAKAPEAKPAAAKPSLAQRLRALVAALRQLPAWVNAHRLPSAIAATALTLMIGGSIYVAWLDAHRPQARRITVDDALAALDKGDEAYATRLAELLGKAKNLADDQRYGPPLVLGTLASRRADEVFGREKVRQQALAIKYLEEARDRGVPQARRGEALFLLGKNLYHSGQVAASESVFAEALPFAPEHATEIHHLLGQAYASGKDPQWAKALEHAGKYLTDAKLRPEERQPALLQRAEIERRLGKLAEAAKTLDEIPADSRLLSEVLFMRGRLLAEEAGTLRKKMGAATPKETDDLYRRAIALLTEAQQRDTLGNGTTPKALLVSARCYLALKDEETALDIYTRLLRRFYGVPEHFAAQVDRADLLRQMRRDSEALADYRETLAQFASLKTFLNPWITLEELTNRALAAYDDFVTRKEFATALELARRLSPLLPKERSVQLMARAHMAYARLLADQVEKAPAAEAEDLDNQSREQYRQAGIAFLQLGKLRITTRDYTTDIWNAAEALRLGRDYTRAIKIYQEYLTIEFREHRAQACLGLGESLLAIGELNEALAILGECLERDPDGVTSYQARLLASEAHIEQGDLAKAEAVLTEIVQGDLLTPASREWRDAIFSLGRVLCDEGHWEAAIPRLEETIARYPDYRPTIETRYLLAEAYRQTAAEAETRAENEKVAHDRAEAVRRAEQCRQAALEHYEQLVETLGRRQDAATLSASERLILRNSFFGRAGALYKLGRYEASAEAYLAAINRYQDAPEVLDAYVQLAACYRRLNRALDAHGTILQAKAVLKQLKPEAPFTETTNYTRDEWVQLLDSLSAL
jgi:tetratricopeptide (TPR) repeat protein